MRAAAAPRARPPPPPRPAASLMMMLLPVLLGSQVAAAPPAPRALVTQGRHFVDASGEVVLLGGTDVIMKGPPWLPETTGNTSCRDRWFTNFTCYTFNEADARHVRAQGWNFIRLGVVWAGGQPRDEPALDPEWLRRLRAILELCHAHGIHVVLDSHQDAVGTATCGEGVPQWFSELANPGERGKPLRPLPGTEGAWTSGPGKKGWDGKCWTNDTAGWALYAGTETYNTRNPCCLRYNQGGSSWAQLELTDQGQATISYLFQKPAGRALYARYLRPYSPTPTPFCHTIKYARDCMVSTVVCAVAWLRGYPGTLGCWRRQCGSTQRRSALS